MRFWHQSSTVLNTVTKYKENIINHAKQVLDPGTTVEPHGLPIGGRPEGANQDVMQYPYILYLTERLFCEAALTAEREGFDAMTIGCNLDIALNHCRSIVDIPVVGVTESSMLASCLLGRKFAFITISDFLRSYLTVSAEKYGFSNRLACVLTMDENPENKYSIESVAGSENSKRPPIYRFLTEDADKAEKIFLHTCEMAISLGAEVLIPGEGILNEFIFERNMTQCKGMPILDANAALWQCATMMVNLKSKSRINISRGFTYKKPDDLLMKQMTDFYEARSYTDTKFS